MSAKPEETEDKVFIFAEPDTPRTRGSDAAVWTEAQKKDLLNSFKSVSSSLSEMMEEGDHPEAKFSMNKIEVNLGISASGKVGFLGTGAEASADASITVTFERKSGS